MTEIGFWTLFGAFGGLASILSLFISTTSRYSKWLHAVYSLFIVGIVLSFVDYQESVKAQLRELERIKRIEAQADALLEPRDLSTAGLKAGYSLAVVTFFEKHKDLYPETYVRAKELCESAGCTNVIGSYDDDNLKHFARMQGVSGAMEALLKGVSSLGNS